LAISQAALHVIRRTVTDNVVNEMLLSTLAPPMPMDDETDGAARPRAAAPSTASVVPKLVSTALESLKSRDETQTVTASSTILRKVSLSGSLGALGILLTDEPRRSILLRVTTSTSGSSDETTVPSLVDAILTCLQNETITSKDDFIPLQLLRFLGQWIMEAPMVVQAVLSSPHAMALTSAFQNASSSSNAVSTMTGLVLGLCMEYLTDESLCGGWTRAGILALIQQHVGVAQFTTKLESLKSTKTTTLSPWSSCVYEWHIWQKWYESAVLVVRKRVIQELTAAGGSMEDNDEGGSSEHHQVDRKGVKAMQVMVVEQATEIEQLRTALAESQKQIASQGESFFSGRFFNLALATFSHSDLRLFKTQKNSSRLGSNAPRALQLNWMKC
jgi:Uso1 / p115 like vesicle tethering protein, head region